tara:strand:- start:1467 stop:2066 length:600 start_codon:yes stop_codon:yes gene_type:complete
MKLGVLALQGGFREHKKILEGLGAECFEVRLPSHMEGLSGLVIPGGESTAIAKLAVEYNLVGPIRSFAEQQKPVWGTCAGAIFMSKNPGTDQVVLGLMDVTIKRNAFGRQVDSFEAKVELFLQQDERMGDNKKGHKDSFEGVFIRAPVIESIGSEAEVVGRLTSGEIVAAKQKKWLVTVFHPELTKDYRIHKYFLDTCR